MPYKPIADIAGADSAIADLYGRADAALKAIATLSPSTHTHDWASVTGKPDLLISAQSGGYWGVSHPGGNNWLRVDNTSGLIPDRSKADGSTAQLGSNNWPWNRIYGETIYEGGSTLATKYAAASHTHSYLPLTGGTLSGSLSSSSWVSLSGALYLDNDNTNYKSIYFRMGGLNRWHLYATSDTENTSDNAGTNLVLRRFNNAGGFLSEVFAINRIDGIVRFAYTPYAAGNVMYHAGNFTPTNIPTQTGTLTISNGAYNGAHLVLGTYHLWISSGKLYIKSGAPTSATDGTVVGTQT